MQDLDHKHLIITAAIKTPPQTAEEIEKWLLKVVDAVDMKILMPPRAIRCDTLGNEGVTGLVCIETSHASIHVWSECEIPFLKFDIYSCKRFDPEAVNACIADFEPYWYESTLIDRNDAARIVDQQNRTILGNGKKYPKGSRKKSALDAARHISQKKDLSFDLTPSWFETAISDAQQQWPKIVNGGSDDSFWKAAIARHDPTHGYTQDNCFVIPHALHAAKWKWNDGELEELCVLMLSDTTKKQSIRDRILGLLNKIA